MGIQVDPAVVLPNVDRLAFTSVKDCLTACDDAGDRCSGITVLSTVNPVDIAKSCKFVTANTNNGVYQRTMIRADLNRLIFPTDFLCPSGYTVDGGGISACQPLTTPTVVVLFLRAEGGCTQQLVSSLQTALERFLSDPTQAFGELDGSDTGPAFTVLREPLAVDRGLACCRRIAGPYTGGR